MYEEIFLIHVLVINAPDFNCHILYDFFLYCKKLHAMLYCFQ